MLLLKYLIIVIFCSVGAFYKQINENEIVCAS
jgi:hypothetical protein